MAANNIHPIYTGIPQVDWGATVLATANTAKDGTGTTLLVFTADATNGGYVIQARWRAAGTNIASVGRLFLNNGSTPATPANNILIDEITLSATTLSEVAALQQYIMPLGFAIPAGYRLYATVGTTVSAGYYVSVFGGKYTASS